jgi:hypothetical protein
MIHAPMMQTGMMQAGIMQAATIDRSDLRDNLKAWGDLCSSENESRLPRLILDVCQAMSDLAIFDLTGPHSAQISVKRKVFENVATGKYAAAIEAMTPSGASFAFLVHPADRVTVKVGAPSLDQPVAAEGGSLLLARLGGLIALALASDDSQSRLFAA